MMNRLLTSVRRLLSRLWTSDRPLTATAVLMSVALVAFGVGIVLDPRVILGAPAWLKPAKFALSTTVYSATLAWLFTWLPAWRRTRAIVGWTTAIVFTVEVAIIAAQAWRGTTSHFNVSTPLDAALFAVMGAAIVAQTLATVSVAVALWREPIANRPMGTALRAAMIITILGASLAGAMTRPTRAQTLQLHETHRVTTVGAHTVGAPDGEPGLPMTGWSMSHGDLRIAHFVGLHALQILPLIALVLRRRLADRQAVRAMRVVAFSYASLVGILLEQALSGEPLFGPGSLTVALMLTWAAVSAAALWAAVRPSEATAAHTIYAGVL